MAFTYDPTWTGQLFNVKVKPDDIKYADLVDHMENKGKALLPFGRGGVFGGKLSGNDLLDNLEKLVKVDHTGESFLIGHEDLAQAMRELESHDRILKASNGSSKVLTEAQLKRHAETVYKHAERVKDKIGKIELDLAKSETGMWKKTEKFFAFHDQEFGKGLKDLDAKLRVLPPPPSVAINTLGMHHESEQVIADLLGKTRLDSVTVEEFTKAQELLSGRMSEAHNRIGDLLKDQTEGIQKAKKFFDEDVIAKAHNITGVAPSAAVVKAGNNAGALVTKEAEDLVKIGKDAEALGVAKKLEGAESLAQKISRKFNTSLVERNAEGIVTKVVKANALTKGMRVASVGAGVVAGLHGIHELVSPGVDEQGKPKEVEVTPQLMKIGAGVGLTLLGLLAGGKTMSI